MNETTIIDILIEHWPSFVIPFVITFCFCYFTFTWFIRRIQRNQPILNLNFDDYKEEELGDIELVDDYKKF